MPHYLPRHKILLVHVPRAGGTTVKSALKACGIRCTLWSPREPKWLPRGHRLLGQSRHFDPFCYAIAFVRHPIAYYESVYKWILRDTSGEPLFRSRWRWHPHMCAAAAMPPSQDFNAWVCALLGREPSWYTRLLEGYVGPDGGETCDAIGRCEHLVDDLVAIMRRLLPRKCREAQIRAIEPQNTLTRTIEWDRRVRARVLCEERCVVRRFYDPGTERRLWYGLLHHLT